MNTIKLKYMSIIPNIVRLLENLLLRTRSQGHCGLSTSLSPTKIFDSYQRNDKEFKLVLFEIIGNCYTILVLLYIYSKFRKSNWDKRLNVRIHRKLSWKEMFIDNLLVILDTLIFPK